MAELWSSSPISLWAAAPARSASPTTVHPPTSQQRDEASQDGVACRWRETGRPNVSDERESSREVHGSKLVHDDEVTVPDPLPASMVAAQLSIVLIIIGGLIEAGLQLARHRVSWREPTTAALLGLGGLLVGSLVRAGFVLAFTAIGRFAPSSLPWNGSPVLSFATAFVAWDAFGYGYHWLGHRTRWGWAAHQVHHTGRTYDLTLAWRQSWVPVHGVVLPLVALGGWPLSTIALCAAVSNGLQAVQHLSGWHRAPRVVRAVLHTAVQHRHHHRCDQGPRFGATAAQSVNLGPVFTVWDHLFGTYHNGFVPRNAGYGVIGVPSDRLVAAQFAGWRALLARSSQTASMAVTDNSR